MSDLRREFAQRVKARRIYLELTQDEVEVAADLPDTQLSHFEKARRSASMEQLIGLSRALNCSCDYLLGLTAAPGNYYLGLERIFIPANYESGGEG